MEQPGDDGDGEDEDSDHAQKYDLLPGDIVRAFAPRGRCGSGAVCESRAALKESGASSHVLRLHEDSGV